MPNFGPVHKLIVRNVGEPYGPLSTDEFEDFEIEHPAECKFEPEIEDYKCAVAYQIREGGARWPLHYVGTPIETPGAYQIQAWAETYCGFEYTEYDGGIALVNSESDATPEETRISIEAIG